MDCELNVRYPYTVDMHNTPVAIYLALYSTYRARPSDMKTSLILWIGRCRA